MTVTSVVLTPNPVNANQGFTITVYISDSPVSEVYYKDHADRILLDHDDNILIRRESNA